MPAPRQPHMTSLKSSAPSPLVSHASKIARVRSILQAGEEEGCAPRQNDQTTCTFLLSLLSLLRRLFCNKKITDSPTSCFQRVQRRRRREDARHKYINSPLHSYGSHDDDDVYYTPAHPPPPPPSRCLRFSDARRKTTGLRERVSLHSGCYGNASLFTPALRLHLVISPPRVRVPPRRTWDIRT
jgi:hypothetical protein